MLGYSCVEIKTRLVFLNQTDQYVEGKNHGGYLQTRLAHLNKLPIVELTFEAFKIGQRS